MLFSRRVVGMVLCAVFVLGVAPGRAGAETHYQQLQDQIRETRQKIHEARVKEQSLMSLIAASDQRRYGLEATIASLSDRLAIATARLDVLNLKLDAASIQLDLATTRLQDALASLEDQRSQVDGHAAGLYMSSTDTYTTVLLGTHDFHDFMAGFEYQNRVLSSDVDFLNQLWDAKVAVSEQRDAVEAQRNLLRRQQAAVSKQARAIGEIRADQATARNAIFEETKYRRRLLQSVRDQKDAYGRALQAMLAESESIEALLRGAQRGQHVTAGMGHGYLVWPTTGRITSPYGWRTHPIYGYRSFHTGIDIGAPSGQNVIAARSGEVLFVGYKDAYGLIVIIDHGHSLATVYAHLSKSYVRAGQYVRTRNVIAAVGSTGWSTGPHLHFEVRVDGQHVNPIGYL
ncbi:MAG: murein hydrolase activator EnvC [Actinomycetota bacterium]|nr:peptidoglycan DD-metalloendopeptidase family protein [Actinomycetota bacterium]